MTTSGPSGSDSHPGARLREGAQSLACGANIDEVLEQVADGHGDQLTEHQQRCEYCQAALTEFTSLWSPVTRAAAMPVAVPLGLVGTLTAAVTAEILSSQTAATAPVGVGSAGRLPLRRGLQYAVATLVVAAIITVIVLVSRHHSHKTEASVVPPAVSTSSLVPVPPTTQHPAGPVVTPPAPRYPTAVPAGSGGQAAATAPDIRNEQLVALLAGLLLIAAGGGYLLRRRR